jgi:hypothetical protein
VYLSDVRLAADHGRLDQLRGVLFALANRGETFFEPVSTLAIKHGLARRNVQLQPAALLDELHSVRDIQRLGHGFWLPCETSLVSIGDIVVALSGMPSEFLERELDCTLFGSGSCRLFHRGSRSHSGARHLSLSSWCRAPESTPHWALETIRAACSSHQPLDVSHLRLEYFNHWDPTVGRRWTARVPSSMPPDTETLARQTDPTGTLYYVCKFENARSRGVYELDGNSSQAMRLGFGLRALAENSASYDVVRIDPQSIELRLPSFMPSEERMVVRALGEINAIADTSFYTATLPLGAWSGVEALLIGLGLSKRSKN